MTDTYPAPTPTTTICRPAGAAANLCGDLIPPATITATATVPTAHGLPVTGADVAGIGILGVAAFLVGATIAYRTRAGSRVKHRPGEMLMALPELPPPGVHERRRQAGLKAGRSKAAMEKYRQDHAAELGIEPHADGSDRADD